MAFIGINNYLAYRWRKNMEKELLAFCTSQELFRPR